MRVKNIASEFLLYHVEMASFVGFGQVNLNDDEDDDDDVEVDVDDDDDGDGSLNETLSRKNQKYEQKKLPRMTTSDGHQMPDQDFWPAFKMFCTLLPDRIILLNNQFCAVRFISSLYVQLFRS